MSEELAIEHEDKLQRLTESATGCPAPDVQPAFSYLLKDNDEFVFIDLRDDGTGDYLDVERFVRALSVVGLDDNGNTEIFLRGIAAFALESVNGVRIQYVVGAHLGYDTDISHRDYQDAGLSYINKIHDKMKNEFESKIT